MYLFRVVINNASPFKIKTGLCNTPTHHPPPRQNVSHIPNGTKRIDGLKNNQRRPLYKFIFKVSPTKQANMQYSSGGGITII